MTFYALGANNFHIVDRLIQLEDVFERLFRGNFRILSPEFPETFTEVAKPVHNLQLSKSYI